jgi:hypothetical protein
MFDISTLGDAADTNPFIKFLPRTSQNLEVDSSDYFHGPLCSCGKSRGEGGT